MTDFWQGKNIIVPGGGGFLGKHLCKLLESQGCNLFVPRKKDYDLRHLYSPMPPYGTIQMYENAITSILQSSKIDIVINLAANVGGIGYNQNHAYGLFYDNIQMGVNLIHQAINFQVKKFVQVGTVCSYPKWALPPFTESALWDGYPEETNAPYGLAKKMLLVQLQAARQEFGFNGIYLIPTNLYGPGDEFAIYRSHVIPALIRKFIEAREQGIETVEVWGTGQASRDFLYVEDAARAIMLAAERYDNPAPLNIGSGNEIRIAWLAHRISELVGYKGDIRWDTSKPDGQPRRGLNISHARHALGWEPETNIIVGLQNTIDWYEEEIKQQVTNDVK